MTDAPRLFSIVTITYKNLDGLRATARSVLEQTHADAEWIVMDGASGDGTVEFLQGIDRPRFTWVSQRDGGIFDAMQKGLERASGRYVIFMNAGDTFVDSSILQKVAEVAAGSNADLLYGDSLEAGEANFYKPARAPAKNAYVMFTHHQAQFYATPVAQQIGYDLSYRLSADWVLTSRVLARPGVRTVHLPFAVCIFERGGASQSASNRRILNRELWRIYREEQRHSRARAAMLWLKKVGVNQARSMFPKLYDRLRYSAGPR